MFTSLVSISNSCPPALASPSSLKGNGITDSVKRHIVAAIDDGKLYKVPWLLRFGFGEVRRVYVAEVVFADMFSSCSRYETKVTRLLNFRSFGSAIPRLFNEFACESARNRPPPVR